jgi:hypothetical protein
MACMMEPHMTRIPVDLFIHDAGSIGTTLEIMTRLEAGAWERG